LLVAKGTTGNGTRRHRISSSNPRNTSTQLDSRTFPSQLLPACAVESIEGGFVGDGEEFERPGDTGAVQPGKTLTSRSSRIHQPESTVEPTVCKATTRPEQPDFMGRVAEGRAVWCSWR
jgi:hypothetical protein